MISSNAWIQTFSGKAFFPLNPNPSDINPSDIAHALARICRFCGHVNVPHYSVAQHSVLLSHHVPLPDKPFALLHDAPEALGLCDLPRPIKNHPLMTPYREAEERLLTAILTRFGLAPQRLPPSVIEADLHMLATEKRDLLGPEPMPWNPLPPPYPEKITPWPAEKAETQFLAKLAELNLR